MATEEQIRAACKEIRDLVCALWYRDEVPTEHSLFAIISKHLSASVPEQEMLLRSWVALIESKPADFDYIARNLVEDTQIYLGEARTYGDGHYCIHHPDDPAHNGDCYDAKKYFAPAPEQSPRVCVKCKHIDGIGDDRGLCTVQVPICLDANHDYRPCNCECEFPASVPDAGVVTKPLEQIRRELGIKPAAKYPVNDVDKILVPVEPEEPDIYDAVAEFREKHQQSPRVCVNCGCPWYEVSEFPASVPDTLPCGHPVYMQTRDGIHYCEKYTDGLKVVSVPDGGVEKEK